MANAPALILASTSAYRRAALERLGLRFEVRSPGVDETAIAGEMPAGLAMRLAEAKAAAVAADRPDALVIGSDQVAHLDGRLLGKPGTPAGAREQLARSSGREVEFLTALVLVDGRDGKVARHLDRTVVRFRSLSAEEIARYVDRDEPLDCAGSFRSEGLGISLFERIDSEDPTALVGLPLIALARLLREKGYDLF